MQCAKGGGIYFPVSFAIVSVQTTILFGWQAIPIFEHPPLRLQVTQVSVHSAQVGFSLP
jgi:hypothetical protein